MVDAALVGLDLGEVVTIPSLPDASDWEDAQRHPAGTQAETLQGSRGGLDTRQLPTDLCKTG